MIKLAKFGKLLEVTYNDKFTVWRHQDVNNDDGTTSSKLKEVAEIINKACRVSTTRPDQAQSTKDDTNPKYAELKVFTSPSHNVRKGDKLVAIKYQDDGTILTTYRGTCNKPMVYPTHQEIVLVDVGDA